VADPDRAPQDVPRGATLASRTREDPRTTARRTPPNAYLRMLGRLERSDRLDPVVRMVEPLAARLVAGDRRRHLLHGEAIGIPPHVILTDAPFGAWFMAQYLDVVGGPGSRQAATRLVGAGLAVWVPTALAGWAEWALADRGTRRVGLVHAVSNAVAALVFLASWRARRRGSYDSGVVLARVGGLLLIVGGFLGGYMRSERPPELTGAGAGTATDAEV
jgi:uncharacterized membrane protein